MKKTLSDDLTNFSEAIYPEMILAFCAVALGGFVVGVLVAMMVK